MNGYNFIYGSLRLDPPIHQLVFIKLLAMASISRVPGTVCIADGIPYPTDVLATTLGVSKDELTKAIEYHCEQTQNRLKLNIWCGIEIVNWAKYQSKSYLRVRKHREQKRTEGEKKRIEQRGCNAPVTTDDKLVTLFNQFWAEYPRKDAKQRAVVWFEKNKPTEDDVFKMLYMISFQKTVGGRLRCRERNFIPLPTTWLNDGDWRDAPLRAEQEQAKAAKAKEKAELLTIQDRATERSREADAKRQKEREAEIRKEDGPKLEKLSTERLNEIMDKHLNPMWITRGWLIKEILKDRHV